MRSLICLFLIYVSCLAIAVQENPFDEIGSDLGVSGKTFLYWVEGDVINQGLCENGKPVLKVNCSKSIDKMSYESFKDELTKNLGGDIEKLKSFIKGYEEQLELINKQLQLKPDPALEKQKKIVEEELKEYRAKLQTALNEQKGLKDTLNKLTQKDLIYLVQSNSSLYPDTHAWVKRFEQIFKTTPLPSQNMEVFAGSNYTCGRKGDFVKCWGESYYGVTNVPNLIEPIQLSTSIAHVCALDYVGVKCWGWNVHGEISPPPFVRPTQVAAGWNHSCAIDNNEVKCWGNNDSGQLSVPSLSFPKLVSAGGTHNCALDSEGVKCWGNNFSAQSTVPTSLKRPTQLSLGEWHSCALDSEGVKCWGLNNYGQTDVPALKHPAQVSAGGLFTCAVDSEKVKCWGDNDSGQLNVPVLKRPIQVAAGVNHACAVDVDGIKCWGNNFKGQLNVPKEFIKTH